MSRERSLFTHSQYPCIVLLIGDRHMNTLCRSVWMILIDLRDWKMWEVF